MTAPSSPPPPRSEADPSIDSIELAPPSAVVPASDTEPGMDDLPSEADPPEAGGSFVEETAPLVVAGPDVLVVRGLVVSLPDGTKVVEDASLHLAAGRVLSLLGPSGSGKSTLLRAITAPDELRARGYEIAWTERRIDASVAFIPQRGALFDHLDVAGNIALAQVAGGARVDVAPWLAAVDLDGALAASGTSVATLSGGQAQRLAVARTLAAGRGVLILDEPSVGLDPLGVRRLARLLVNQARERGVAVLVITHDLALAAGASDTILYLDAARSRLVDVALDWPGPAELASEEVRREGLARLDAATTERLSAEKPARGRARRRRAAAPSGPGPLDVAGAAILHALNPRLFKASMGVLARTVAQSLFKPMLFYAVVGALLGFTVLYIIAKMSADLRAAAVLRLVGGTYILSLAPPLSAILFASTSGNAVNAWLGGMQLGKQVLALEGLGVTAPRYLWSPAWLGLAFSYLCTVVIFVASMIGGGWALFELYGAKDAIPILTSDFLDPAPGRGPYLVRGVWLSFAYAAAIATIVVGRGAAQKDEAAHVTAAMTSAVIRTTLFVVAMELASVAVLFAVQGR